MHVIRLVLMVLTIAFAGATNASPPDAQDLVNRAETTLWGRTLKADFDMTITTPAWSRTLGIRVWMDRPRKSFLRVIAPAKDAGILSLRIESEMWNYIPAIERTIKVPPSLMLQPWLGSDFTNDDLVKESSIVNDYTHRMLAETMIGESQAYEIESTPKPGSAVVWGRLHYAIRSDGVPLRVKYFDQGGKLVRTLDYLDIRTMGGRRIPTRWEMRSHEKPGKRTTILIKSIAYDTPIAESTFSMRNLQPKE